MLNDLLCHAFGTEIINVVTCNARPALSIVVFIVFNA